MSIVGSSGYTPHTAGTRLLFLVNSLIGASTLSLLLSYLVQVYSALRERNGLGLTVDLMTGGTGDAAEMLARLGPGGDFSNAPSQLGNLVQPLASTKEAHHFYPLLMYFRFREPIYSVSRIGFVLLDLTTLIQTSLDRDKHGSLARAAPVDDLRRCALMLLETLDRHFPTEKDARPAAGVAWKCADSYASALETLRKAGIEVRPDEDRYCRQRDQWESIIRRVTPTFGFDMDEIDSRRMPQGEMAVRGRVAQEERIG